MREKKFTKGPWIVGCNLQGVMLGHKDENGNLLKTNWHYGGHPKAICKFVEVPPLWMEGEHFEMRANASLISAAPELLEALEFQCLRCLADIAKHNALTNEDQKPDCGDCVCGRAIAKAYGETE